MCFLRLSLSHIDSLFIYLWAGKHEGFMHFFLSPCSLKMFFVLWLKMDIFPWFIFVYLWSGRHEGFMHFSLSPSLKIFFVLWRVRAWTIYWNKILQTKGIKIKEKSFIMLHWDFSLHIRVYCSKHKDYLPCVNFYFINLKMKIVCC